MSELLRIDHLEKRFPTTVKNRPFRLFQTREYHWLHAVDDISFDMRASESVGLVGESGCGKSTLGRVISRLADCSEGRIWFDGQQIESIIPAAFAQHKLRAGIQMVFQDSTTSLNPRFMVAETISEPLRVLLGIRDARVLNQRVTALADQVGLPRELLLRYPHQLSGGQKARVNIARALAPNPKLVILDEPTAALDVSVQATILKLLDQLRHELGVSFLFISHDLNLVRLICDRVLVMYLGKIVESGTVDEVFAAPRHPYTQELIATIPRLGETAASVAVTGEPQSPIDPDPNVCRFYGRCPKGAEACVKTQPELRKMAASHRVACHFSLLKSSPVSAFVTKKFENA